MRIVRVRNKTRGWKSVKCGNFRCGCTAVDLGNISSSGSMKYFTLICRFCGQKTFYPMKFWSYR